MGTQAGAASRQNPSKKPFYHDLWVQVLVAVVVAVALGYLSPGEGVAMKPLGDAFIKLITMVITLVIFCTVVSGIAGLRDIRKVGRIGGKALLYFEVLSTLALVIGMALGDALRPGVSLHADPAKLDAKSVESYAGQAKSQSVSDFLLHIVPTTVAGGFVQGDILQVLLVSILFGLALSADAERCRPVIELIEALTQAVFGVIQIIMRFAPAGAFGALAFTVGRYGVTSLGPLMKLVALFWMGAVFFVMVMLGIVARLAGFSIVQFLLYIKEEIVLVVTTCSSDAAMPTLMEKMTALGCSKPLVGLVVPAGYVFNTDGSALYMTLAALFVAQATQTPLTMMQQMTIFAVALLSAKGASGVQGAAFVALVATLTVVPDIPVAGMALLLGIDRFMAGGRGTVNMIGNGVASLVVARWEGEIDAPTLRHNLRQEWSPAPASAD